MNFKKSLIRYIARVEWMVDSVRGEGPLGGHPLNSVPKPVQRDFAKNSKRTAWKHEDWASSVGTHRRKIFLLKKVPAAVVCEVHRLVLLVRPLPFSSRNYGSRECLLCYSTELLSSLSLTRSSWILKFIFWNNAMPVTFLKFIGRL